MTKQIKLEARERVTQILHAALDLAETVGYSRVTRDAIGHRLGIAPTLVAYHCGTMAELRRNIMREAIRIERLPVIAQGLAVRDSHALKAPADLRAKAIQSIS